MVLAPFKEFISEACGLRFDDKSGEEKLGCALAERLQESGCADQERYLGRIRTDHDEFQRLVNLLTINETYFFRESEQLHLLAERIVPRLLIRNNGQLPIKILSAGCSSGEEPYSLTMSLRERYGESLSRFCTITGVDIDSAVLAKARAGHYGEFSFRGVSAELRNRYFDKSPRGWQVKGDIRSLVSFQELNLLAPVMPQSLYGFDVIFFRNVSIYFDEPTRRQIQQNLASLLKDDGILIIGCSETIANDLGVFQMVEEEGLFYFIKGNPPLAEQHTPLVGTVSRGTQMQPATRSAPAPELPLPVLTLPETWQRSALGETETVNGAVSRTVDLAALQQLVQEKRYDEALSQLATLLAEEPGNTDALLLKAAVLLNRKQFETVRSVARQVLEKKQWSIDAFLLSGLAAKWDEKPEEAISWFKQAVYACHTCWPAHYHLADSYNRSGEAELAKREYRAVLQLISHGGTETGITVLALGLPAAEIRLVSEHQLTKLGSRPKG